MRFAIENIRIFREDGTFAPGTLYVGGNKLIAPCEVEKTMDGAGMLACPGLLDIHTHGCAGADFTSADAGSLRKMADDYASWGVTTVLPTLASDTYENWLAAIRRIGEAGIPAYRGIHLEGRWLAPARRGAHAPELLKNPDAAEIRELSDAARELPITRVSLATELPGGEAFLSACRERGIKPSQGHTDADYAAAMRAFEAGAHCFTHLFNAMPPLHHRAGGPVAAALTEKGAYAELICDGLHIAPETVRLVYECKGSDRLILISDSMAGTGCPDGAYDLAGQTAVLKDGRALTPDGKLAGSTLHLLHGVQNLSRFCRIPFGKALLSATRTPAGYMGLLDRCGQLLPGTDADLFLLPDENAARPARVLRQGQWL